MTTFYDGCGWLPFGLGASEVENVGKCGKGTILENDTCTLTSSDVLNEALRIKNDMLICSLAGQSRLNCESANSGRCEVVTYQGHTGCASKGVNMDAFISLFQDNPVNTKGFRSHERPALDMDVSARFRSHEMPVNNNRDDCEELYERHPEWWRKDLHNFEELGFVKDIGNSKYELGSNATDENMFKFGYLGMCSLGLYDSNKRNRYPDEWQYGDPESDFEGVSLPFGRAASDEQRARFTRAIKQIREGRVKAQEDRGL
jgi:hypothetical protein